MESLEFEGELVEVSDVLAVAAAMEWDGAESERIGLGRSWRGGWCGVVWCGVVYPGMVWGWAGKRGAGRRCDLA